MPSLPALATTMSPASHALLHRPCATPRPSRSSHQLRPRRRRARSHRSPRPILVTPSEPHAALSVPLSASPHTAPARDECRLQDSTNSVCDLPIVAPTAPAALPHSPMPSPRAVPQVAALPLLRGSALRQGGAPCTLRCGRPRRVNGGTQAALHGRGGQRLRWETMTADRRHPPSHAHAPALVAALALPPLFPALRATPSHLPQRLGIVEKLGDAILARPHILALAFARQARHDVTVVLTEHLAHPRDRR